MRRRGPPGPTPLQPEVLPRTTVHDQRASPRGQLKRQCGGMRIIGCLANRRHIGIDNDRGTPRRKPRKPHCQPFIRSCWNMRGGQRMIEPALLSTPTAMKPRQCAIAVTQGTQCRRDPIQGCVMLARHRSPRLMQRSRRPSEQREHIQQFFGIAGRQAPIGIDQNCTILRERFDRRVRQFLAAFERKPCINQPGQRLKAWQAGRCPLPALREEPSLLGQRAVKGVRGGFVLTAQQEQRVVDPSNHPPPGQIRRPAGARALAELINPAPDPVLRLLARPEISHGSQIVQPCAALPLCLKSKIRRVHIP